MQITWDWPSFLPGFSAAAERAGFHEIVLGEFAAGPLKVWQRPAPGPHVYLSAGIHGDEPAGPLAMLEMMRAGFFTPGIHWTLCPALNPDGLAAGSRSNSCGIDLNRDYWLRSSSETAAHSRWLETIETPDLFVSLHEDWETSGFYFYEINLRGECPERGDAIISAVRPWFPPEPGPEIDGHQTRGPGWIYHEAEPDLPHGWPEAIFLAKRGCPLSFTFETPSRAPLPQRVAALVAGVRAACQPHL
jgi:murein peptide amidase A